MSLGVQYAMAMDSMVFRGGDPTDTIRGIRVSIYRLCLFEDRLLNDKLVNNF